MKTLKKWQLASLFISGIFFGGGLDHVVYAICKSETSHYGFNIGIGGNWLMSLLDFAITAVLLFSPSEVALRL